MPTRHVGPENERLALDVFIKLNRACTSVMRRVHPALRELGLNPIQFGVLDTLRFGGPLPISTIAEKNLCSQNSLCTVIDTMERHGLVRRRRHETDRRVVLVELEEAGERLFEKAWPGHLERVVEATSSLTLDEQRQLDALLRRLGRG